MNRKLNKTKIRKLYLEGVKVKDIAKQFNISRQTVYRITKDLVPFRYNQDVGKELARAMLAGFLLLVMLSVIAYITVSWFVVMNTLPPDKASPILFTTLLLACCVWVCIVLAERAGKIFKSFVLK